MTQLSLWEQWTDAEKQAAYEDLLKQNWNLRHAARDHRDALESKLSAALAEADKWREKAKWKVVKAEVREILDSIKRIILETRCCPGGPALTVKRLIEAGLVSKSEGEV